MSRGREEYDVFLTQDDFAVFTDDDAECCVNVGICDLPMDANTPDSSEAAGVYQV